MLITFQDLLKQIVKDPTHTDLTKALGIPQERFDEMSRKMAEVLKNLFTEIGNQQYTRAECMEVLIKANIAENMTEFALMMFFIGGFVREQELQSEAKEKIMNFMGAKAPMTSKKIVS